MYILYFDNECFEYRRDMVELHWLDYPSFRAGEGFWLIPGTHPEDTFYYIGESLS